ncbi:MAG TPA: CaiB/BaiF CoA-transferase family protein [Solirubrobacteraceae bacterium]|jgi:alpha-methylacyl-CoA racemase
MGDGPLTGVRVVELAGIGPAPFAAMLAGDFGADVIRVDRPEAVGVDHPLMGPAATDVLSRGRRSVAVDLKSAGGRLALEALLGRADVLLDPFRPGVLERLLGPLDALLARHPRLILVRITGWGQDGPYAQRAGHDLTYLAATGALGALGHPDREPAPPLNLVADFGGGGMLAAVGLLLALLERERSGRGQVIDAAMVDGVNLLLASVHGWRAGGRWADARASNLVDGGAPFYRVYRAGDGRLVAVAALEPSFYAALLSVLGLEPSAWPQHDRDRWPALQEAMAAAFATAPGAEWARRFEAVDACVELVADFAGAAAHPAVGGRDALPAAFGAVQPAPAPRLSRTPGRIVRPPARPGEHTVEVLRECGYGDAVIDAFVASAAIRQA